MQQRTERILWGIAGVFVIASVVLTHSDASAHAAAVPPLHHIPHVMMFDPSQFANTAEQIVMRDPFRLERKPASVSFGTPNVPVVPAPVARSFQSLALRGILGGPPWQAIFAGVPNRENNVVARVGDTLAGLRVVRIQHDDVVLRGRDTVLTLTFIRTWQ